MGTPQRADPRFRAGFHDASPLLAGSYRGILREAYSRPGAVRRLPSTSLTMKCMTVRDQPGPGVAGAAGEPGEPAELAEPAACAHAEPRLRADAARNRAAIVTVARAVFAEHGLEAPLEVIAARAGVGIATLYRRFPTPIRGTGSPDSSSGSANCRPVTAACPICCP